MPPTRGTIHYDTPTRAKIQGDYHYLQVKAIPFDPRDIFREFGVSERQGYAIIQPEASARRRHNIDDLNETRGRKCKLTSEQVRESDQIIELDLLI